MMASKEGGIVRGGEATSHANNGVKYIVKNTGKLVELEGDEIVLCQDALNSKKVHTFNDTPLNILKAIADEYGCKRGTLENIYGGEFVICKKVVRDDTPVEVCGTPAEVVSKLQADKGCNVHWSYDIEKQDGESCNVCEHEEAEKNKMAEGGGIDSYDIEERIIPYIEYAQRATKKLNEYVPNSHVAHVLSEYLLLAYIERFLSVETINKIGSVRQAIVKGDYFPVNQPLTDEIVHREYQRLRDKNDTLRNIAKATGTRWADDENYKRLWKHEYLFSPETLIKEVKRHQVSGDKMEEGGAMRVNKRKMLSSAFKKAAKLMADAHFKKVDLEFTGQPMLVHAEVVGNGAVKGKKFSHAWVEDNDMVYDLSSGKPLILPKYQYYQIAKVKTDDPKKYKRYTYDEVAEKILTTGEYCWDLENMFESGGEVLTFYEPDMFIPDMGWDDGELQNPPYEVFEDGGALDTQLEFEKVGDKIFAVKSKGQEILAKTFIRFNSYLDSSKFKGKIFTLKEFADWYASERDGKFTYYTDFKGFNVPDTVFKVFFDGSFDPLSIEEKWLLDKVKEANVSAPYYVIGYVDAASESTTKIHELAHAFYYLFPEYKEDANAIILKLETELANTKALADVKVFLLMHKYNQSMWADELQAYLIADKAYMAAHKAWSEELEVYSERLKVVFNRYRGVAKMEQGGAVSSTVTEWQQRMIKAQELAQELRSSYNGRLHINSDASITLYHLTGKQPSEKIKERGFNAGTYFFASKSSKYNGDTLMNYKDKHDNYVIMEVHVNPCDVSFSTGTGEFYSEKPLVRDFETGMYSVSSSQPKKFGEKTMAMEKGGEVKPKLKRALFSQLPRNYQIGIVIRAYEVNEDVEFSVYKNVREIDWLHDDELVDTLIADYAKHYPDRVFAYGFLPLDYLIDKIKNAGVYPTKWTWEEYHNDYSSTNDAKHTEAVIPIMVSDDEDEFIEDGWHRFHRYIDMGLKEIPVVSYNPKIKLEDGGSVGMNRDEEIQMYLDIISDNPKSASSEKYKGILKTKFDVDFDAMYKDDEYIASATLEHIRPKEDFMSFDNYIEYAKRIFYLRGIGRIQPNHKDGEVTLEQATAIGKILGFKVKHKPLPADNGSVAGNIASHDLIDEIRMPEVLDVNTFIHEVGHDFDNNYSKGYKGKAKTITYASSPYAIAKNSEVFAENFMHYFIAPEWLRAHLPEVYEELNKNIPTQWKYEMNKLLKIQAFRDGGLVPRDLNTDLDVHFGQKFKDGTMIVAHSTSSNLLPVIYKEGLKSSQEAVWDNTTQGYLYFEVEPTATYYSGNVYAWKAAQKYGGIEVTLYVRVPQNMLKMDTDDSHLGSKYRKNQKRCACDIPPEDIIGLRSIGLDIKRKDFKKFAAFFDDRKKEDGGNINNSDEMEIISAIDSMQFDGNKPSYLDYLQMVEYGTNPELVDKIHAAKKNIKMEYGGGINGLNGSNTDEFEAAFTDFELEGDLIINKDPQPDGFSGDSWEQGGTVFEKGGFIPPKPPTKRELEARWDKKKDHIMQLATNMRRLKYNLTIQLKEYVNE